AHLSRDVGAGALPERLRAGLARTGLDPAHARVVSGPGGAGRAHVLGALVAAAALRLPVAGRGSLRVGRPGGDERRPRALRRHTIGAGALRPLRADHRAPFPAAAVPTARTTPPRPHSVATSRPLAVRASPGRHLELRERPRLADGHLV